MKPPDWINRRTFRAGSARLDLRLYLPYLALLLPLLLVLPGMFSFPYPAHGESDLAVSHYPNAVFLLDALKRYGGVPLWSPTILSGYPFFADPLSGLWYPPGWLVLALPLPFGFNLLVALHLIWGGLGMTWLLRSEGLAKIPALAGGVAFACLPKLYAHFGAGHLTLLYAVPWMPWLLAAGRSSLPALYGRSGDGKVLRLALAGSLRLLLPGVILALIFLADARAAAYAGALWLAYMFSHSHVRAWLGVLARLAIQVSFALLIAAPLALPLLEYTRLSTRSWMQPADVLVYSLPPARLLWLLFPDFSGFHEFMLYPGAAVLVLALAAIAAAGNRSNCIFWMGVFIASLLFSLGEAIPGMTWLVQLPGLDLIRVPSRSLFITGMALAALAAYGLDALLERPDQLDRRRLARLLVILASLTIALTAGITMLTRVMLPNMIWGAAAILVSSVLVGFLGQGRYNRKWILLGLFFLAIADWSLVDRLAYIPSPVEQVLSQGKEAADYLAAQEGRFRTYSPSYSLPQQTGALHSLELADGVDPLQLVTYAEFMDRATGVPRQRYSATIPPYATGSPWVDNKKYVPDSDLLGLLGVRYVLAGFDQEAENLTLVHRFGNTRLYENSLTRPMAWVQPESSPIGDDYWPVIREDWAPNRIEIEAAGPGLLVLSEVAYPGWRVWVDGAEVEVQAADGLLRAARLGPGVHKVIFRFQPASLYYGVAFLVCGLLVIPAMLWFYLMIMQRKNFSRNQ